MAAGGRFFGLLGKIGIGLAITGGIAQSALYNVDGGQRAVIFDRFRGVQQKVIGEGTHFIIPMVQYPIIYDCRSKPRNIPVITGSKDLQNVHITLRILYRPKVELLPQIYSNLGIDYEEKVLPSITTEVLKAVVAQFDASDLITQREVTHLNFGREFSEAVEMKAVAQQEAERARYLVEKAEQTKRAMVIAAEGDSKAAELLADAFHKAGEGLIELRKFEAAEEIATQLSQNRGVTWLPTKQGVLLNIQPGGPSGPALAPGQ